MHRVWREWRLNHWLNDLENRNIQEIQLGLTRIQEVAQKLNLLKPNCKVITVAGTNGKGSTVSALEMIYHSAGYKVGAYTSPHLIQFNERIRLNLQPITDKDLCNAFCVIEEARQHVNLTYFEMTTLAALWFFKQQDLDVLILEVGLGGRLDATNIVDADLSVITTIDFDHQDYLGHTLDAIGYEKAGILRPQKPFIYADLLPPASIINVAKDLASPGYFYKTNFTFRAHQDNWDIYFGDQHLSGLPLPNIQLKSASAAIVACFLLAKELPVEISHYHLAMRTLFVPGRLQLKNDPISILYDVSHNPQAARLLADTINQLNIKGSVHAVFAALKDKDIFGLISPLKACVDRWYPAQLDNKRATNAEWLMTQFKEAEIFVQVCYNNPLIAFNHALEQAKVGDLIVIYGSFFTVGHVMAAQPYTLELKEIQ